MHLIAFAVYLALLGSASYMLLAIGESRQHRWTGTWRMTAVYTLFCFTAGALACAIIISAFSTTLWPTMPELWPLIAVAAAVFIFSCTAGALRAATYNNRTKMTIS